MSTLPQGIIRVRLHGRIHSFLVQEIHWAPVITVISHHGEIFILPVNGYPQASALQVEAFWLQLEQALHNKHTLPSN